MKHKLIDKKTSKIDQIIQRVENFEIITLDEPIDKNTRKKIRTFTFDYLGDHYHYTYEMKVVNGLLQEQDRNLLMKTLNIIVKEFDFLLNT